MSFDNEYNRLLGVEGAYSNDKDDPGGETYNGISRVFHPGWGGWPVIDALKAAPGFPGNLSGPGARRLDVLTREFYRAEYWDRLACDEMPDELAGEVFEQSVNLGTGRTVKHLQRVLTALNREPQKYADLLDDGAFGPRTLAALRSALADGKARAIRAGLNALQGAHYVDLGLGSLTRRKYVNGWLAQRVA